MRKKYVNWWCGLLLLLSSFPVITWCGAEILDTTTAAVASKLNPVSPPTSSSVNSTSEQTASKSASATASVLSQTLDSGPVKEKQTEAVENIVEELHSSFEESTEVDDAGSRQNSETLSETSSAALPSKHSDNSDTATAAKILHAEETLATLSSSLLVEPHNDSLTPENNVTDIVHEADTEDTAAAPPHVSTTTPAPSQVPSPVHASSEVLPAEQPTESAAANHTDGEEIPSFNEWAQKQLEEAEKRKVQNASEPPRAPPKPAGNLKLRSKNYASPDCGAKIVAANPEAQSVSSVLSPSRDEYALNPCTSTKIWFVVELCEAVQAKQVDLANFELFSSSPKEFSVWVSDRFPTREWHAVGQFTAQDERTVQSFGLEQHLFAKFMRVELHSHWGSEHFCPVSLLRVFGVSEFEVLDTEEEGHSRHQDDDDDGDDELVTVPGGDAPKNLFGSARDAVISIVKKAAQVLVKTGNSRNMTDSDSDGDELGCGVSPLPNPPGCLGCSPRVLRLLACRGEDLQAMLASPYVVRSLQREGLCQGHVHNDSYLAALLPIEYISALCQLLPIFSQPHHSTPSYDNLTIAPHDPFILLHPSEAPSTCSIPSSSETSSQESATQHQSVHSSDPTSEIRPTKTLKEQESSEQVQATGLPEAELVVSENITVEDEGDAWSAVDTILSDLKDPEIEIPTTPAPHVAPPAGQASIPSVVIPPVVPPNTGHTTQSPQQVVTIQIPPPTPPTQAMNVQATQPPSQQPVLTQQQSTTQQQQTVQQQQQQGQQKESVFVRLANRIKALERNMSLSAQYLEELSKRYKKQVEEMQRAFERTLTAVGEASRQAAQREVQHAESLAALEQRLGSLAATTAALMAERDSWHFKVTVLSQHVLLFAAVVWIVLLLVRQCTPVHRDISPEPIRVRRHSVETLCTLNSRQRKRRPSEEAGASSTPLSAPPVLNSPFIFSNPSCERHRSHISEWRNDPSRKKRRRLRRELRGVSVEELCSGLSPATLAAVRPRPAPLPPSSPRSMESSRRHSTESSPLMVRSSMHTVHLPPEPEPPPSMFNVPVETIPASPCVQQRKTGGLRKMVRKLF